MSRHLNLASRPFRNETVPALAFAAAALLLIAASVRHAVVVRGLLPGRTSALHEEAAGMERELAQLRAETAGFRSPKPDAATLARWRLIRDLVDQRTFSWTDLFSRLEAVLPPGVRLVAITPTTREGEVRLELTARVESPEAGLDFARVLEERAEFDEVYPLSQADRKEGDEFVYSMRYRPVPRVQVARGTRPSRASDDEASP